VAKVKKKINTPFIYFSIKKIFIENLTETGGYG
jgi:hypothetical protein